MEKLQILVATMRQNDFSLVERMNLQCPAILANQAGENRLEEKTYPFGAVRMITTDTRGVGLNRNIALLASDAELLLFADDDLSYYDGTREKVIRAFAENPRADVIVFSVDISQDGKIIEKRHLRDRRLHLWQSMRFGTYAIGIRTAALRRSGILFSQLFGGGCIYSTGEDSLFLRECFRRGLRVYGSSCLLGNRSKDASSWFTGYHEKYFYDKGALMAALFPRLSGLMVLRFGILFKKHTALSCGERLRWMYRGRKGFRSIAPYAPQR